MSPGLQATLLRARDYAASQSQAQVLLEHLLLALTEDADAAHVLEACQVDLVRVGNDVAGFLGGLDDRVPPGTPGAPAISPALTQVLKYATLAAQQGRRSSIDGAIVLAALVGDGRSMAASFLKAQGLTFEAAIQALRDAAARGPTPTANAAAQPAAAAPAPTPISTTTSAENILAQARERLETRSQRPEVAPQPSAAPAAAPASQNEPEAARPAPEQSPPPAAAPSPAASSSAATPSPAAPSSAAPWPHVPPAEAAPPQQPTTAFSEPPPSPGETASRPASPSTPSVPAGTTASISPAGAAESRQAAPAEPQPKAPPQQPQQAEPPPRANGFDHRPADPPPALTWPTDPSPPAMPEAPTAASWAPPPSRPMPPQPPAGRPMPPPQMRAAPPLPPAQPPQPSQEQWTWPAAPGQGALAAAPGHAPPTLAPTPTPANQGYPASTSGRRPAIDPSQIAYAVPRRMRQGRPCAIEVWIERPPIAAAPSRSYALRPETVVARAIAVRLKPLSGRFVIDAGSPETQWDQSGAAGSDRLASEAAVWRFTVTPLKPGRASLQLGIAARTLGADGVLAETQLPDQVHELKVSRGPGALLRKLSVVALWTLAGMVLVKLLEAELGVDFYFMARQLLRSAY
jgi:hypothetical protein